MASMDLLQTKGLSDAKATLSDVMTEVVHRHHPIVVDRHRGKEAMLLFAPADLQPLLAHFRFEPQTSLEDGQWTIFSPELNLTAGGESFDLALEDLVESAEEYAQDFFARQEFYTHTDRAQHMPWLLRLALTQPSARRALFVQAPDAVRALA
jgi:Antitoxin of toxin-antitoxin, RelE / RelB, TA system